MAATATPSWKTPRVLLKALGTWCARDDTRPDPKARQAAEEALTAIAVMQEELEALYGRVRAEIALADRVAAATAPEASEPSVGLVDAVVYCGADWGSATPSQPCVLRDGHLPDEPHMDCDGHRWGSDDVQPTGLPDLNQNYQDAVTRLAAAGYNPDAITLILTDAAAAAGTGFGFDDGQLIVTAEMVGAIPLYAVAESAKPERAPILVLELEGDEWTDEEIAALPPMFSPAQQHVGPWPYARAA